MMERASSTDDGRPQKADGDIEERPCRAPQGSSAAGRREREEAPSSNAHTLLPDGSRPPNSSTCSVQDREERSTRASEQHNGPKKSLFEKLKQTDKARRTWLGRGAAEARERALAEQLQTTAAGMSDGGRDARPRGAAAHARARAADTALARSADFESAQSALAGSHSERCPSPLSSMPRASLAAAHEAKSALEARAATGSDAEAALQEAHASLAVEREATAAQTARAAAVEEQSAALAEQVKSLTAQITELEQARTDAVQASTQAEEKERALASELQTATAALSDAQAQHTSALAELDGEGLPALGDRLRRQPQPAAAPRAAHVRRGQA